MRVESQAIRQALLVTGNPLDPNELPEKLQLFNELGEPLMIGGSLSRNEISDSSGVLPPGYTEPSVLTLFASLRIFKIKTDRPARVRVYPTAAMRDADSARSIGTKPVGNHGRLLEVVTTANLLELVLSPSVDITSAALYDKDFYVSVTNLDSAPAAVVVTYYYIRTE